MPRLSPAWAMKNGMLVPPRTVLIPKIVTE
jgi:hypothetical protein